ncbi:hypothetical protein O7626_19420 [Micromonospora sp. WMMD1102]|uniref:hypothetical protein n=1 Tax=Micromonospora sp. WMMD1102 TaxID=3016105 RepID=UPI0024152519|nr:hypothetical protein [Micromonospora sp. WMMD1102]MDG4788084.1 hypothetical protein [Micromonospora sp. WMMD1102]
MGLFRKKSQPAPDPVDRGRVMRLIQLGMAETDAGDRDLLDDEPSPEFLRAKAAFDAELRTATLAERQAAIDAIQRHGY